MWMKRHVRKPACGANNGVARRPNQVLTAGLEEIVWCAASWETVKSANEATVLITTLMTHGQVSVTASAVEAIHTAKAPANTATVGHASGGTGSLRVGDRADARDGIGDGHRG